MTVFLIGLARACAGALLFALPLLMTMEMWAIGLTVDPLRLAALTLMMFPVLVGLSYFIGFEETSGFLDDALDAAAAYLVGAVTSGVMLMVFAIVDANTRVDGLIGRIALQAVPASVGALLAQSELGAATPEEHTRQRRAGYIGSLFFMAIGALFLAFNIAPTEEVLLLAETMTALHLVVAVVLSLILMHAFVYGVEFSGHPQDVAGVPSWSLFARYTVPGYVLALLTCATLLWVFGRTDGLAFDPLLASVIVLGVPASVGAAAARLIL